MANVTKFVIVPPVPVLRTFTTVAGTVNVTALTAPVNVAVPPMLLRANVPTPLTVVPVTSAPATAPVLKFKSKVAPVTAPRVMSPAFVNATVFNVVALPNVIAPNVIASSLVKNVPFIVTVPPTATVLSLTQ